MRDNFSQITKDSLAKRVGYLCSNPNCSKHTSGPNEDETKATNIGVASHITAASEGGPRYDNTLSELQRKHINNGIWLCNSCSVLIDKDPDKYSVELLKEWKKKAEEKMRKKISGITNIEDTPFLQAEVMAKSWGREPLGISKKNIELFEQPIPIGVDLYKYWKLKWSYKLLIHNNSEKNAYDISILGDNCNFEYLEKLPRVNNLKALDNLELELKYTKDFHGTSAEADEELTEISKDLIGKKFIIKYRDGNLQWFYTESVFDEDGLDNKKIVLTDVQIE